MTIFDHSKTTSTNTSDSVAKNSIAQLERMHKFVTEKIDTMISTLQSVKATKQVIFDAACDAIRRDADTAQKAGEITQVITQWVQANGTPSEGPSGHIPSGLAGELDRAVERVNLEGKPPQPGGRELDDPASQRPVDVRSPGVEPSSSGSRADTGVAADKAPS